MHALIADFLEQNDVLKLHALLEDIHPADLAEAITHLSEAERQSLLPHLETILSTESLALMLTELPATLLNETIEYIFACGTHKRLESVVASLESDDIVSLIEDLGAHYQEAVIDALPKTQKKQVERAFTFPEDSAGRMMQQEFLTFSTRDTLSYVLQRLKSSRLSKLYDIYITDEAKKLVGFVCVGDLLKHRSFKAMGDIMTPHTPIAPDLDQESVIQLFKKYSLMSAPVVNDNGNIIGVITADDVVYAMDAEADEDVRFLGGVLQESTPDLSIWRLGYYRIQWLIVTFTNTLISSSVLYQFESILSQHVTLAILMPIVASMGGSVAMQVVTLMIRYVATQFDDHHGSGHGWSIMRQMLRKEIQIAGLIGVVFAILITALTALWFSNVQLGFILGGAMLFNILWAGSIGTVFPLLIYKLGFDPAVSSGPLVTTLTDVFGFGVFLGLATLCL